MRAAAMGNVPTPEVARFTALKIVLKSFSNEEDWILTFSMFAKCSITGLFFSSDVTTITDSNFLIISR